MTKVKSACRSQVPGLFFTTAFQSSITSMILHTKRSKAMFDFDDISTWSSEINNLFDQYIKLLKCYKAREFEIMTMPSPERWTSENSFEASYQIFLNQLNSFIRELSFCSYHATRLTDDELLDIRQNGLKPLSQSDFIGRLNKAVNTGLLTQATAGKIIDQNSGLENRENILWFVCGKNALKFESGMADFFSFWGGEAMAQGFYENDEILKELRGIGEPYLIKTIIHQSEFTWPKVETFIEAYLSKDDAHLHGIDIQLRTILPADRILRIISRDDEEFLQLTGYKNWQRSV